MSDQVGNPEDRFSRVAAHMKPSTVIFLEDFTRTHPEQVPALPTFQALSKF